MADNYALDTALNHAATAKLWESNFETAIRQLGKVPRGEFDSRWTLFKTQVRQLDEVFEKAVKSNRKFTKVPGKALYDKTSINFDFLKTGITNQRQWSKSISDKILTVSKFVTVTYKPNRSKLEDAVLNLKTTTIVDQALADELGKYKTENKTGYLERAKELEDLIDSIIVPENINVQFDCQTKWYINQDEYQSCYDDIDELEERLRAQVLEFEALLSEVQDEAEAIERNDRIAQSVLKESIEEFSNLASDYSVLYDLTETNVGKNDEFEYRIADSKRQVLTEKYPRDPNVYFDPLVGNAVPHLSDAIATLFSFNKNVEEINAIIDTQKQIYLEFLKEESDYRQYEQAMSLIRQFDRLVEQFSKTVDKKELSSLLVPLRNELDTFKLAIAKHEGIKKKLNDKIVDLKKQVDDLNKKRKNSRELNPPFDDVFANIERLKQSRTLSVEVLFARLRENKQVFESNQIASTPIDIRFVLQDKFFVDETDNDLLDAEKQRIDQLSKEEYAKIDVRDVQFDAFTEIKKTVDSYIVDLDKRVQNVKERLENTKKLFQSIVNEANAQKVDGLSLYFVGRVFKQLGTSEFKDAVLQALRINDLDDIRDSANSVVERAKIAKKAFQRQLTRDRDQIQFLSRLTVRDETLTDIDRFLDEIPDTFVSVEPSREELVLRYKEIEEEFNVYNKLVYEIETELQRQAKRKADLATAAIEVQKSKEAYERQLVAEKVETDRYDAVPDDWKEINRMWRSYRLICINGHVYTEFDNVGHWYCHQHAGQYEYGKWTCCDRTNRNDTGCVNADHRPSERPFTDQQTIYNVHEFVLEQLGSRVGIEGDTIVRYDKQAHEARSGHSRKRILLQDRTEPLPRKVTFIEPVLKDVTVTNGTVELPNYENYFWDIENGPRYVGGTSVPLADVALFRVSGNTFAMGDVVTKAIVKRDGDDYVFAKRFPDTSPEYVSVRQLYRS